MTDKAIQDHYPDKVAICYGCGRNNPSGLHVKSYWKDDQAVCRFMPAAHHTAFPGVVYGGLVASLIDCHSIGTAIAAAYQAEGRAMDTEPEITCVTANLSVRYLKPTPMGAELELRARVKEADGRKTVVHCSVFAGAEETARGEVVAVRVASRLNLG